MNHKGEKGLFFYLTAGMMELSWLYAIALLATTINPYPFPFFWGIVSFFLALFIGRLLQFHVKWQLLLAHLLPFLLILLGNLYQMTDKGVPFFKTHWLTDLFSLSQEDKILLLPFFSLMVMFWIGGHTLSKRPTDYSSISTRFDLGVFIFFCLFLIEALGEIRLIPAPTILALFFLSSLLGMSLSRDVSTTSKRYLKGVGSILSFALVLLLVVAMVSLSLPLLKDSVLIGYGVMKVIAEPMGSFLLKILEFLLLGPRSRREDIPIQDVKTPLVEFTDADRQLGGPFSQIFFYVFLIFFSLIFLFLLGFTLYSIIRWLSSPLEEGKGSRNWKNLLHHFLLLVKTYLKRWKGWGRADITSTRLMAYLLLWGKRSGYLKEPGETPKEYAHRLGKAFPMLKGQIHRTVYYYYQEVFGGIPIRQEEQRDQEKIYKGLKNPGLWPKRLLQYLKRSDE